MCQRSCISHTLPRNKELPLQMFLSVINPAGRLVQTWPKSLDQIPRMSDYDITIGRTYMYFKGEPLYPFGYGLSYSKFEYANLKLSSENMANGGSITVTVDIKNTGSRDGDEVVQLYARFPNPRSFDLQKH